jgi:HD superfamily phosphodiesterase
MDNDRLKHSYAVAKKMMDIAMEYNLSEEDIKNCFLIGLNHDIGYEFTTNGINHNKIGGQLLRDNGFKYWQEVYYHGDIDCIYNSIFLDILNKADMQIDKYGNDVGYDRRLEDIKLRYGEDSIIYKNCVVLIESLKTK